MKAIRFGAILTMLGTTACVLGEPNVYALPQAEIVDRLARVDVEPSGNGPFFMLDLDARRAGAGKVVWSATGSSASQRCEINVSPAEDDNSRVDISCNGGGAGSGAATGLLNNMMRKRAIELVDATIEGRPFDPQLAQGATAAGWPADRIDHGNYGDAVADAVAMDRAARDAAETGR